MKGVWKGGFSGVSASMFFRGMFRLFPQSLLTILLLMRPPFCFAQKPGERPAGLEPLTAEREARNLVAEMLAQKPESTNTGLLKIRDSSGQERQLPIRFEIWSTASNSTSIYEATDPGPPRRQVKLTVIRSDAQPNEYLLSENGQKPAVLTADRAMVPFAGSDFFLGDLGLEFLHWPQQRLLKKEMRRSRFCEVLESTNPRPTSQSYSRVVCWVEAEPPHGIVHADAYDARGKIFKRFDPTGVEKVQGQYQLQEMEIRNVKNDSRTRIEFNLDQNKQ